MAQPSESPSQPPPEASLDKLHHLQDDHRQLNGQPPLPTDGTRTTTSGGSGRSSTTTTSIETGDRGDRGHSGHRQPSETSLAADPSNAPLEAALHEGSTLPPHNVQNGTRSSSGSRSSPSLSMSNTQPPPGSHRQPVSYPSPTSFPSPGMPPTAQYAYPQHPGAHADPYRASPTAVNSTMSLPSMRTIDPRQPQPTHSMVMGNHMGAPMPSGAAPIYYNMPPHPYNMHPDPNALRYALPPNVTDPRIALSGGRHKKEIKRRTKTGCLTCRKRRIKCDETHPTCNNCKKSKRDCLGYDPIFKQQPGPAILQPAPNSQGASPTTLVSPPTVPSSTTHPFQPPIVPSSYPPTVHSNATFGSPLSSTAKLVKSEPGYSTEYPTAIDPALGSVDSSAAGNPAHYQSAHKFAEGASLGNQKSGVHTGLRGGTPFPLDPLQALLHFSCNSRPKEITLTYAGLPAKKMRIDELVALGGGPPPPLSSPPSAETVNELILLYFEVYVPGLTMFFESSWYDLKDQQPSTSNASNSLAVIRENRAVVDLFTSFLQTVAAIKTTDPADMVYSGHLETSLVWSLASLPYSPLPSSSHLLPGGDDAAELRNRLTVFEALLSGETLQSNPLLAPPPAVSGDKNFNQVRANELDFWYHLGQYVQQTHSSASPADAGAREHCLSRIRSVLDGRENRDVLYSIAVLREYAPRFDAIINEQTVPAHLDEMDPRSKLAVATRFIRDEAASTGGTTNVVRRFADLAYRAFVRPGVNVNRSAGRGQ